MGVRGVVLSCWGVIFERLKVFSCTVVRECFGYIGSIIPIWLARRRSKELWRSASQMSSALLLFSSNRRTKVPRNLFCTIGKPV
jgi:hypothetical protein